MHARLNEQALLFEGADRLSADLNADLLAVDGQGLLLEVWLPHLLGAAQRKADVIAVLLALAGDFTFLHDSYPLLI